MKWRAVLCLFLSTVVAEASSPGDAVAAALADCAAYRPVADRVHLRYLSLYAIPDADRPKALQLLAVHVNSLSRSPNLVRPVLVRPDLVRVDLRDYRWDPKVWEKLAAAEPYFTVHRGKQNLAARWLPREKIRLLLGLTNSQIPVIRADWFFAQTAISADRVAGYYQWLGLKSRNDYFALVGADQKKADALGKQWIALILKSKVAIHNRLVDREGVLDAGRWQTRDAFQTQTRKKNALLAFDKDFQHDAEEHIAPLPNGLFAYYLSDAKGVQQDSAPDQVGPDTTSTSNDGRIHNYLSCVRCHEEGLRPLRDYGRKLFTAPQELAVSTDKALLDRLAALYLRPLERHRVRDNLEYRAALAELAGEKFTPFELSKLFRDFWEKWNDDDVSLEQAARELGTVTPAQLQEALRVYGAPKEKGGLGKILPGPLLGLTKDKPLPVLREHWEESFDTVQFLLETRRKR